MQIQEGARRREELARQRKMNAKMWNLAFKEAYNDNCDYFFQCGDD